MNFIGFSIQQTSLYSYIFSARTGLRILLPLLTGYESRGGGEEDPSPIFPGVNWLGNCWKKKKKKKKKKQYIYCAI
jgi:hypothetical protein